MIYTIKLLKTQIKNLTSSVNQLKWQARNIKPTEELQNSILDKEHKIKELESVISLLKLKNSEESLEIIDEL